MGTYLQVDDGSRAVAAAALVASINGRPIDESPHNETARQWIARVRPSTDAVLTDLARQAVIRAAGPNSELTQLWGEAESSSWRSGMDKLRDKLGA